MNEGVDILPGVAGKKRCKMIVKVVRKVKETFYFGLFLDMKNEDFYMLKGKS